MGAGSSHLKVRELEAIAGEPLQPPAAWSKMSPLSATPSSSVSGMCTSSPKTSSGATVNSVNRSLAASSSWSPAMRTQDQALLFHRRPSLEIWQSSNERLVISLPRRSTGDCSLRAVLHPHQSREALTCRTAILKCALAHNAVSIVCLHVIDGRVHCHSGAPLIIKQHRTAHGACD